MSILYGFLHCTSSLSRESRDKRVHCQSAVSSVASRLLINTPTVLVGPTHLLSESSSVPQPTGPGCQRKTPWCVHTNDPVNLGSGPELWLQFANAVEFGENTVVLLYCTYPPLFWLNGRFCADSQNEGLAAGWGKPIKIDPFSAYPAPADRVGFTVSSGACVGAT